MSEEARATSMTAGQTVISLILVWGFTLLVIFLCWNREYEGRREWEVLYTNSQNSWKSTLINRGFAEYDRKTGEWKLFSKEDVCKEQAVPEPSLLPELDLSDPAPPVPKKKKKP